MRDKCILYGNDESTEYVERMNGEEEETKETLARCGWTEAKRRAMKGHWS